MLRLFEKNDPFKITKSLDLLGLKDITDNKALILNEISNYLFKNSNTYNSGNGTRVFDLVLDYQYYFVDFLKFNINLNKQDIDWWEFDKILGGIMLDDNSTISTVIGYRTYEKPPKNIKIQEEREHKFRMQMKRKYSLPNKHNVENCLEKLFNYVENKAKAGDNK